MSYKKVLISVYIRKLTCNVSGVSVGSTVSGVSVGSTGGKGRT